MQALRSGPRVHGRKSIVAALTTRIKVLSGLDIAERRRHQDGRIEARIGDRDIDLRVSTYASLWGENVVIRILNRETALVDIDKLGLSPLNQDRYQRMLAYPSGVILVTGPTGSGKTTTLYASLMVRTLCPFCKEPSTPEDSVLRTFTSMKITDIDAHTFYRPVGCPQCAHTGYRGRTAVHELLEINEPVKEAILARKTASQMRLIARESAQLISMAEDGFYKAVRGITTLQEVLRHVFINACDASTPYELGNFIVYCRGEENGNVFRLPEAHNRA